MTAATANRNTPYRGVTSITMGAKTAVHIYAGAMVFNDAGWARGGTPTATTPVIGSNRNEVDNSGGGNGALNVVADREGAYPFFNGASGDLLAQSDVMSLVFAIDDATVGKTNGSSTRPTAGMLVAIDANGYCWVQFK